MNNLFKKKILAVEMVMVLIVSGSVGYVIVSRQGSLSGKTDDTNDDSIEETIKPTVETPQPLKAHIDAGPLLGYPPLTVQFNGNLDNDPNIVAYQWEFGPTTSPIIPHSQYKTPHFSIALFFIFTVFYLLIYGLLLHHRYKTTSQYSSTERDPAMVFVNTGSYSATLTVTDTQGNTSSDTVWITVLQYVYPDHDND